MGYYTRYNFRKQETWSEETLAEFAKWRGETDASFAVNDYGEAIGTCKWYEWESDLRWLSKRCPEQLFVLFGEGEDPDDLWVAYALGGLIYKADAEIVYPKFDATKLKEKTSYER